MNGYRVEPCACGGIIRVDLAWVMRPDRLFALMARVEQAVDRHNASLSHRAWRLRREDGLVPST